MLKGLGHFCKLRFHSATAIVSCVGIYSYYSTSIPANAENKILSSRTIQLNDGNHIPTIGLGTFNRRTTIKSYINDTTNPRSAEQILKDKKEDIEDEMQFTNALAVALDNGYRHIDTAQIYRTENIIGNFLSDYLKNNNKGITRKDIWITTKVSKLNRKEDEVRDSIDKSLADLKSEYIDLFLIHSPHSLSPIGKRGDDVCNIYRILHEYKNKGKIRSVGVSNFGIEHLKTLERLYPDLPLPSVNQIEVHCFLYQKDVIQYCLDKGILIEAYCPIARAKEEVRNHGLLRELSRKYDKTWAQIMIKYLEQNGYIVLTKSVNPQRIIENADIFDFMIDQEDIKRLNKLSDLNMRVSWNPLNEPWDV